MTISQKLTEIDANISLIQNQYESMTPETRKTFKTVLVATAALASGAAACYFGFHGCRLLGERQVLASATRLGAAVASFMLALDFSRIARNIHQEAALMAGTFTGHVVPKAINGVRAAIFGQSQHQD